MKESVISFIKQSICGVWLVIQVVKHHTKYLITHRHHNMRLIKLSNCIVLKVKIIAMTLNMAFCSFQHEATCLYLSTYGIIV